MVFSQSQDLLCSEQIQRILGNFDTDGFDLDNYASLSNSLERYSMAVWDPTYLSGSQVDHVHLSNATLDNFKQLQQLRVYTFLTTML